MSSENKRPPIPTTTTTTTPPRILTSSSSRPASIPPPRETQWYEHLTLDLFVTALNHTILHPFVAWVIVLCLRAQAYRYTHPAFITAAAYAAFLSLLHAASGVSDRIGFGLPRDVDRSEEVVVITGGASGLGLLVARIYGLRGVSVAVLDVKAEAEIEGWEEVCGVDYYQCDVGDRVQVEETAKKIEKDLGTPTVLMNCAAGRINAQPLLSLPSEAFQKTIQTNLMAVAHTCQVFVPRMLTAKNGGTIVNISSVVGQLCPVGLSDYSASKAGLSALHRTLETELRMSEHGNKVKMVLVECGQISTPLFNFVKTPNSFFAPVLEPIHVAQEVVSVVDQGRGGVIRMPTFAMLVNWYAVLPVGLQRIARYISGIDLAIAKSTPSSQPSQSESKHAEAD
ncbi:hypothetical protein P175DRAFT_0536298 [Aspergillus ochraceoroseus IBT 24754]|uniref:Short-chain dehydrogenase/reductase family protein n=2 Tax=Aspergillus ochraceoroseus TaxID=138278 RepID=A0A2T5LLC9_9EURO|nr:uncharacterized protein P175DRAFT_0536298 [Aspergillus ochraceoroseus IBT 24754]KKK12014.1 hypothetical protein AOCH_006340 [Aspergillus ochraceoroseus]PTU17093.1 hypothetical protein P175DRAFT_0536298 [Aspergillus ochraceoroseus IBT 24754]